MKFSKLQSPFQKQNVGTSGPVQFYLISSLVPNILSRIAIFNTLESSLEKGQNRKYINPVANSIIFSRYSSLIRQNLFHNQIIFAVKPFFLLVSLSEWFKLWKRGCSRLNSDTKILVKKMSCVHRGKISKPEKHHDLNSFCWTF